MADTIWEQPWHVPTTGSKYDRLIADLKANPGDWAVVGEYATYSVVTRLRKQFGEKFELTSSKMPSGTVKVWARFTG